MREDVSYDLMWFYSNECDHCLVLEPEVESFAKSRNAKLHKVESAIIDEDGIPQVPGLMYMHPKVANHIFLGSFCLDALRYILNE